MADVCRDGATRVYEASITKFSIYTCFVACTALRAHLRSRPKRAGAGGSMLVSPFRLSLGSAVLLTLGGCTTYTVSHPAVAYYAVPCSTPGAFVAEPIDARDPTYGPQVPPPPPPSPSATAPQASNQPPPTCMIAAPISQARYFDGYYGGRGYYDPYYYGYGGYGIPFYGGIGIGLHGGEHGWGGHGGHGFGHGGGGHSGPGGHGFGHGGGGHGGPGSH